MRLEGRNSSKWASNKEKAKNASLGRVWHGQAGLPTSQNPDGPDSRLQLSPAGPNPFSRVAGFPTSTEPGWAESVFPGGPTHFLPGRPALTHPGGPNPLSQHPFIRLGRDEPHPAGPGSTDPAGPLSFLPGRVEIHYPGWAGSPCQHR